MAVYGRGSLRGSQASRFLQAWWICRASLAKQGYLTSGSAEGPSEQIYLTAKGSRQDLKHKNEPGKAKERAFDNLYYLIQQDENEGNPQHGRRDWR